MRNQLARRMRRANQSARTVRSSHGTSGAQLTSATSDAINPLGIGRMCTAPAAQHRKRDAQSIAQINTPTPCGRLRAAATVYCCFNIHAAHRAKQAKIQTAAHSINAPDIRVRARAHKHRRLFIQYLHRGHNVQTTNKHQHTFNKPHTHQAVHMASEPGCG